MTFLLYGATGFVGRATARLAFEKGYRPLLAGRNAAKVASLAAELGLDYRVFRLEETRALETALEEVKAVLHCAGPFVHTFKPMVDGCLRTGRHYLDLTGEIPVLEAIATRDEEAVSVGVMLLPAAGFDVVATDCLAVHLQRRLPSATRLRLAFQSQGPAGVPPGTLKTVVETIPYGLKVRRGGRLEDRSLGDGRLVDFGGGSVNVVPLTWGDLVTAFHSTGIATIEDYAALPQDMVRQMKALAFLRPLFRLAPVRGLAKGVLKGGSTPEERARTRTNVWGEVEDDSGRRAVSRLHGPEAGVDWTALAALAAVGKVLNGQAVPGFQTPAMAYGPDFVLESGGVTREDVL